MADFNKPNASSDIVTVMSEIRDNESANARQFKGSVVDNIPLNAVKFDEGIHYRWDSSNWNTENIAIAGGGTGSSTASGARTNLDVYSTGETDTEISTAVNSLSSSLGSSSGLDTVSSSTDTTSNRVLVTGYDVQALSNVGSSASADLVSGSTDTTSGRVLTTGYDVASLANAGNVVTLDVVNDISDTTAGRVLTTGYGIQYLGNAGSSVTEDVVTSSSDTTAGRILLVGAGVDQLDSSILNTSNTGDSVEYDVTTSDLDIANGSNSEPKIVRSSDGVLKSYHKKTTINFASDANITLSGAQNLYGNIELTDSGSSLTTSRDVIVSDNERVLSIKNSTDYAIKLKTSSGTGVHVESGEIYKIRVEGGNVVSHGTDNLVIITPWGEYASGYTETYPNGLSQTDFEEILFTAGDAGDDGRSRIRVPVSKFQINADPTGWDAICTFSSSSSNVTIGGQYATANSYQLGSQATVGRMKMVTAHLKDGVTY